MCLFFSLFLPPYPISPCFSSGNEQAISRSTIWAWSWSKSMEAALWLCSSRKMYHTVPRQGPWYCIGKSGMTEECVEAVQDVYDTYKAVVWHPLGMREEFKVHADLHQASTLRPFLFGDSDVSWWKTRISMTMMFTDGSVIYHKSREQVRERSREVEGCCGKKRVLKGDIIHVWKGGIQVKQFA